MLMDIPVFVSKQAIDQVHIKALENCFRKNKLKPEGASELSADLEALKRLEASRLLSNTIAINCKKRIYRRYQDLVRDYGSQMRAKALSELQRDLKVKS